MLEPHELAVVAVEVEVVLVLYVYGIWANGESTPASDRAMKGGCNEGDSGVGTLVGEGRGVGVIADAE